MADHVPNQTDLAAIADRIKRCREDMSSDALAFVVLFYKHESIDVEAALRRAARPAAEGEEGKP